MTMKDLETAMLLALALAFALGAFTTLPALTVCLIAGAAALAPFLAKVWAS